MLSLFNQTRLKSAVSWQTTSFLLSSFATKLEKELLDDKITAGFVWNKYASQALHQTLQTTKPNFEKLLG